MDIVIGLEEVHVQHYHGEGGAKAGASGNLLVDAIVELAVII